MSVNYVGVGNGKLNAIQAKAIERYLWAEWNLRAVYVRNKETNVHAFEVSAYHVVSESMARKISEGVRAVIEQVTPKRQVRGRG